MCLRRGRLPGSSIWGVTVLFMSSYLGYDNLAEPLTNSANRPRDGEKRSPVTATGARTWAAMADKETNGEKENARNAGQVGSCGNGCAVNKLRGKHCRERVWLPKSNKGYFAAWRHWQTLANLLILSKVLELAMPA